MAFEAWGGVLVWAGGSTGATPALAGEEGTGESQESEELTEPKEPKEPEEHQSGGGGGYAIEGLLRGMTPFSSFIVCVCFVLQPS